MNAPRGERPAGTLVKGKWRLVSVLRGGTSAALYLAKNRTGGSVALKIIHPQLAKDERVRARLLEEAVLSSKLDHPGVVRVIDEDEADDGAALLLLEPLDGETLDARRRRLGGMLALEDVFDIAELLLDVMRAAHDKGILHFELTPQNLFLTDTGLLKILDFGALDARPRTAEERGRTTIVWPAAYTAPELLLDEASDARSDIWAVGALLYTLVTGSTTRAPDAPAASVASVPARSLKESPLELPRAFVNIVDRALEFDRADRWPDVEAMQQALRWARRSLEGGWGQDPGARDSVPPRASRSSLTEQARLSRLSAPPPKPSSDAPQTGPTPVDVQVTMLARWRDEAVKNEDTRAADASAPTPPRADVVESTLVGVKAAEDEESAPPPDAPRLHPRRASEPTLKSAGLVPDSERKPRVSAPAPEEMVLEDPPPTAPKPKVNGTPAPRGPMATLPPVSAPPRKQRIPSTPPPSSGEEEETIIRAAPALDAIEAAAKTPALSDEPALAQDEAESITVQAPTPVEVPERVEPPPTVRLPSRHPPPTSASSTRRVLMFAAVAGLIVGALTVATWPRKRRVSPPPLVESVEPSAGDAALAIVTPPPAESAAAAANVVDDASAADDAEAGSAALDAGAVVDVEEDAAAALEARLAAERRKRRERAALEAAQRAKDEAGAPSGESSGNPYADASESAAKPQPAREAGTSAPAPSSTASATGSTGSTGSSSDDDAGS